MLVFRVSCIFNYFASDPIDLYCGEFFVIFVKIL